LEIFNTSVLFHILLNNLLIGFAAWHIAHCAFLIFNIYILHFILEDNVLSRVTIFRTTYRTFRFFIAKSRPKFPKLTLLLMGVPFFSLYKFSMAGLMEGSVFLKSKSGHPSAEDEFFKFCNQNLSKFHSNRCWSAPSTHTKSSKCPQEEYHQVLRNAQMH
jgi:hypothetical protein